MKAALTTALLTLALAAGHASRIPLLVIPTVLPLRVDIEKRLRKSEEYILAELVLTSAGRSQSPDSLHSLPETTRNEISRLALRDFLEKRRQAAGYLLMTSPVPLPTPPPPLGQLTVYL